MKVQLKKLSGLYISTVLKMRLEVDQRKAVAAALRKVESHYAQLLEDSYHMQEQLRSLSRQILNAHEEERKRISRELHDEVGQILAGINIRLAALTNETTDNTKNIKNKIVVTQRLVEKSMQTIHQFARELRPAVLDDVGLIPALQAYAKGVARKAHIPIHFKVMHAAKIKELDGAQRTAFFRVAQEALNNVAQHAKASLVHVSLRRCDGVIHMEIKDNGKSFPVERVMRVKRRNRLGLLGMRERMEIIGGTLTLESKPGKGTTVHAQAPSVNSHGLHYEHTLKGIS